MDGHYLRSSTGFWWALIAASFALSIMKQIFIPYNHDNALHIFLGQIILEQGDLYRNFLETNPPLYPYLMTVVVKLGEWFHVSAYVAFRVCTFLLASLSLYHCHRILSAPDSSGNRPNPWMMTSLLAMVVVAIPDQNFGQRDHIILLLILPYVTLLGSRLANQPKEQNRWGIWFALAIAIAIKPSYIFVWIFSEIAVAVRKKTLAALFSPTNALVLFVGAAYVVGVILVEPAYFSTVLPLALDTYGYIGHALGNTTYKLGLPVILICACILRLAWRLDRLIFAHVAATTITLAGLYCTWLLQSHFVYQLIPFLVLFARLFIFLFMLIGATKWISSSWRRKTVQYLTVMAIALLFVQMTPKWLRLEITTYVESGGQSQISWSRYFPGLRREINLLDALSPNEYAFIFTSNVYVVFPALLYSKAKWRHRMYTMWPLPALHARGIGTNVDASISDNLVAENIRRWTVEDFKRTPPKLILVDISADKSYFSTDAGEFDYLDFFGASAEFSRFWSNYQEIGIVRFSALPGNVAKCFSVNLRRGSVIKVSLSELGIQNKIDAC